MTSRFAAAADSAALLEILALQGVKTVYGGVTVPNEKSGGLHQAMGFRRLGTYRSTGFPCDWRRDVAWFEKNIAPYDPASPPPPHRFGPGGASGGHPEKSMNMRPPGFQPGGRMFFYPGSASRASSRKVTGRMPSVQHTTLTPSRFCQGVQVAPAERAETLR